MKPPNVFGCFYSLRAGGSQPQVTVVIDRRFVDGLKSTYFGAKQKATRRSPFFLFEDLRYDLEIGPAAMIHPDTTAVVAPTAALPTRSVAALLQQLHAASCVSRTVVPVHVIR
jgi:hypothetical protein